MHSLLVFAVSCFGLNYCGLGTFELEPLGICSWWDTFACVVPRNFFSQRRWGKWHSDPTYFISKVCVCVCVYVSNLFLKDPQTVTCSMYSQSGGASNALDWHQQKRQCCICESCLGRWINVPAGLNCCPSFGFDPTLP